MALRANSQNDLIYRTNVPSTAVYTEMFWVILASDVDRSINLSYRNNYNVDSQWIAFGCDTDGVTLSVDTQTGVTTGSALTVGTWAHLAFVKNGTRLTLHLDGKPNITLADAGTFTSIDRQYLFNAFFSSGFFDGWSDAAIAAYKQWDGVALTSKQIRQEMQQYVPVNPGGLRHFLPMIGDTAALCVTDLSPVTRHFLLGDTPSAQSLTVAEGPQIPWRRPRRTVVRVTTGIAFDAASNSGAQVAQSTYSWSHTCTGSDRHLAVDVSLLSAGASVTGITYNGVALSLIPGAAISTVTSFGRVECWGLANPTSGSNTIEVTLSGSITSVGMAVSRTGVHQTSPVEAGNAAQATNVGAADATVSITSVADQDWIHAALATDDTNVTAGQTARNEVNSTGSGADEDFGPQSPGAKSMTFTDVGALATWAIAGYAIRPVTAASLVTSYPRLLLLGVG